MPGGAKRNPLPRYGRIRGFRIIGCDEFGYVDQVGWVGRLSCKRADFHRFLCLMVFPSIIYNICSSAASISWRLLASTTWWRPGWDFWSINLEGIQLKFCPWAGLPAVPLKSACIG